MMAVAPELFGFLKTTFPDEFSALVTQVETTVASGGNLDGLVQAHLLQSRQKYGSHLAGASDASLSALLTASIDLQKAVFDGEGAATCGSFAVEGAAVFEGTPAAAKYEDLMLAQTVLLLAAANGGYDAPVARDHPNDADWRHITDLMSQSGVTQSGLATISTLDVENPDLCPALLTLLTVVNTDTTDAGARVRAEYLVQLGAM